ncbi:MAG TPA: nuclear transport factor 2 family protein, partial [Gemmatimonadaceae bacterium]|nr:nuclear transport factor 2 family protein [Gemmatimonadaceae bacterium]
MSFTEGVAATLRRITAAWMEHRWDELAELFDPSMVMLGAGLAGRIEGREAIVAWYRERMERAPVDDYREESPEIDLWGTTAVATLRWAMSWTADGVPERHSGRDLFVLHYDPEPGEWRALWRTTILDPAP